MARHRGGRRVRRRRAARHRLRHLHAGDRRRVRRRPALRRSGLLHAGRRRPVTARPGLRLEAHGALERRTGRGRHPPRGRRLRARGGRPATRCSSPTSGGWPATPAGWRRCAPGATVLAAAGPARRAPGHHALGATPTGSPASTRRSPSTPTRSSCGTVRVATSAGVTSALDLTLSFVEEDHGADAGPAGGPRAGHLPAAAGHAGPDEPARRGARARPHDVVREVVEHVDSTSTATSRRPCSPTARGSASGTSAGCSAPTWAQPRRVRAARPHRGRRRPRREHRPAAGRGSPAGAASARPRPCARPSSTPSATRPRPTAARSRRRATPSAALSPWPVRVGSTSTFPTTRRLITQSAAPTASSMDDSTATAT